VEALVIQGPRVLRVLLVLLDLLVHWAAPLAPPDLRVLLLRDPRVLREFREYKASRAYKVNKVVRVPRE
tara:strand:- start:671 stop:877 length:207 start_codon:yes stop_codon:yes gene_type:complete